MTAVIRRATVTDARGIGEVQVASWRTTYPGIVPDSVLAGLSVDHAERFWRDVLGPGSNDVVWVADDRGVVVGFAFEGPARDDDVPRGAGEVHAIYLLEAAQGRGIGSRLFAAAVDDLARRGFAPLMVWAIEGNARAWAFYERRGWAMDGAHRPLDFDGTIVEEWRLRLDAVPGRDDDTA